MQQQDSRRISEMRNLGPACESDLNLAGIQTAEEVKQLGVEETFLRMLVGRKKLGKNTSCCNAVYLYALHGAIHDIDWRAIPEEKKKEYRMFAAEIRESGRFR